MDKFNTPVFIFGSNAQGFHCTGSAGYAMRGTSDNTWRTDPEFLKIFKSQPGSIERIGHLAVFGIARGYQLGRNGHSYAIQTIVKPGKKRSISLTKIGKQFYELMKFAEFNSHFTFQMTPVGTGYSGYTIVEMNEIWDTVIKFNGGLPSNILADGLYTQVVSNNET